MGLDLVRQLDAGTLKTLPRLAPTAFVPRKVWPALTEPDGNLARRTWDLGLVGAVRDALRSGDVSWPARRRHISCATLGYDPIRWQHARDDAYPALQWPQRLTTLARGGQQECAPVATQAAQDLAHNDFVTMRRVRLPLKRRAALELSPRLQPWRRTIAGALPRVRIEDLLTQVDAWGRFPQALRHSGEQAPRVPHFAPPFLATLIAHGTHLGLAMMAHSVEHGITANLLHAMSPWCLREDTLKAATARLVNCHHRVPLRAVWGDGTVSSSDGQRFGLQASALLGSLSPRYCGYYDPALTVYTHSADQQSVLHTQVMAGSLREASYVLDGLLANETIRRPKEHGVDQHGETEQLFGLGHWLGSSLMPRRPVRKQTGYTLDRTTH